jgi:hypothetical protein
MLLAECVQKRTAITAAHLILVDCLGACLRAATTGIVGFREDMAAAV